MVPARHYRRAAKLALIALAAFASVASAGDPAAEAEPAAVQATVPSTFPSTSPNTSASPAPTASPSESADQSFQALMDRAMDRMHADMHVTPSGDADRDFARMMIPHHQGAIDMALVELRFGKDERLRRLAQAIIVEQQQEIAVMQSILAEGAAGEHGYSPKP